MNSPLSVFGWWLLTCLTLAACVVVALVVVAALALRFFFAPHPHVSPPLLVAPGASLGTVQAAR